MRIYEGDTFARVSSQDRKCPFNGMVGELIWSQSGFFFLLFEGALHAGTVPFKRKELEMVSRLERSPHDR